MREIFIHVHRSIYKVCLRLLIPCLVVEGVLCFNALIRSSPMKWVRASFTRQGKVKWPETKSMSQMGWERKRIHFRMDYQQNRPYQKATRQRVVVPRHFIVHHVAKICDWGEVPLPLYFFLIRQSCSKSSLFILYMLDSSFSVSHTSHMLENYFLFIF